MAYAVQLVISIFIAEQAVADRDVGDAAGISVPHTVTD
jgi:hypothetical protein